MKIEELAVTLTEVKLAYQRYDLSEEVIKVWFKAFSEVDFQVFYSAIWAVAYRAGQTDFPTIGQVKEYVDQHESIKKYPLADVVFKSCVRYASFGINGKQKWLDELKQQSITFVEELLDFNRVRMLPLSELEFLRIKFVREYNDHLTFLTKKNHLQNVQQNITSKTLALQNQSKKIQ